MNDNKETPVAPAAPDLRTSLKVVGDWGIELIVPAIFVGWFIWLIFH